MRRRAALADWYARHAGAAHAAFAEPSPPSAPLTERETRVVAMLAAGEQLRAVARTLQVCEGTARNDLRSALRKTGMRSKERLAAWYYANAGEGAREARAARRTRIADDAHRLLSRTSGGRVTADAEFPSGDVIIRCEGGTIRITPSGEIAVQADRPRFSGADVLAAAT